MGRRAKEEGRGAQEAGARTKRAGKKREAKERAERQAKEEWERYKAEKKFEMSLPQDILEFKNNPIKKVWRNLIIKYHPDKGGNEELMKIINSIWETFTGKY